MKTTISTLIVPLLTIFFSFVSIGCYTQLAGVENSSGDETYPIVNHQTVIVSGEPVWMDCMCIISHRPSPPVVDPLPAAGHFPIVSESNPHSQTRDSGYQRSPQTENSQAGSSGSVRRPSDVTRGRR